MNRSIMRAVCALLCFLSFGCGLDCNQQTCDCFSEAEDDVFLRFDLDSLNQGFRKAELMGAYLVRYAPPAGASACA